MKSDKARKTAVYGLLVAALIWGYFNNPFSDKPVKDAASEEEIQTVAALPATETGATDYQWKRNPFKDSGRSRSAKRTVRETPLRLTAISKGAAKAMVEINNKYLWEGDVVSGWQVSRIDQSSVLLEKNGKQRRLHLGKN